MKRILFLSVLGFFAFSVAAANVSISPPIVEENISIVDQMIVKHADVYVPTLIVESVVLESTIPHFDVVSVFTPSVRAGYVYHPVDYEQTLCNVSQNYATNHYLNTPRNSYNSIVKCREDTIKESQISSRV